jgi:hypothetical protein
MAKDTEHSIQRREFLTAAAAGGAALIAWKAAPNTQKAIEQLKADGPMLGTEPVHNLPERYNVLMQAVLDLYEAI